MALKCRNCATCQWFVAYHRWSDLSSDLFYDVVVLFWSIDENEVDLLDVFLLCDNNTWGRESLICLEAHLLARNSEWLDPWTLIGSSHLNMATYIVISLFYDCYRMETKLLKFASRIMLLCSWFEEFSCGYDRTCYCYDCNYGNWKLLVIPYALIRMMFWQFADPPGCRGTITHRPKLAVNFLQFYWHWKAIGSTETVSINSGLPIGSLKHFDFSYWWWCRFENWPISKMCHFRFLNRSLF